MENSNPIIVGLDIGTTKIACFVGQREMHSDKVRILGYGKTESAGVDHGVVLNIVTTADSIRRAVEQAADQANVDIEEVYVGIAGQHIKSIQNQGSIMIPGDHSYITKEDVERLIDDQNHIMLAPGEQIIHIFPQNYIVDGEMLSSDIHPVGVAGKQLKANFHIVTGNTGNILNIRDAVKRAGLSIKRLVLEPIASAFAILDKEDRAAGATLVDIGGGTTDIAIFHEGYIRHTSVLPVAGKAITKDIKDGCNIMQHHAEKLKTRYGCCLPQQVDENDIISIPGLHAQPAREIPLKTLAGIIKARTESILEQVGYEINQSGYDKRLISGVVLTGGGAQLRHIKELADYTLGIYTRIGIPNTHLVEDTPPELLEPMYATGIGLVLYGIDEVEHEEVNQPVAQEETSEPETTVTEPEVKTTPSPEEDASAKAERNNETNDCKKEKKSNIFSSFGQSISKYLDRLISPNEPYEEDN